MDESERVEWTHAVPQDAEHASSMRTKELYERMLSHGYMGRADDSTGIRQFQEDIDIRL